MNWKIFKRLLIYPARYKWRFVILILVSLFGVVLAVTKPLPIKVVIDNVLIGQPIEGFYLKIANIFSVHSKEQMLWLSVGFLAFITVFSSLINYFTINYSAKLGMRLLFDLSIDLFTKFQQLSLSFYSRHHMGDLIQRFTGDAFVVYLLGAQIILPIITSLFTFAAMFYVMVLIDSTLAFIAISVIPLLGLALALMSKKLNDTTAKQYQSQGDLSAFVHQSLSSIKMVQAFVREHFIFLKLRQRVDAYEGAYTKAIKTGEVYNQTVVLITGLASAALVGLGAYKGFNGDVSAGELYIFLGYLSALYGPVNSLSTAFATAISFGARGKRIVDILDSEEYVKEIEKPEDLGEVKGTIELKDVNFSYSEKGEKILKDINIELPAGKTTAFIGPTGAGKTSLISLLNRFYDPTEGEVSIDGHSLKNVKLYDLRKSISMVTQEPFLFPMTIKENIAFGNPYATDEEIIEASKMAEANAFIEALPKKYDTAVAEAGVSLSGGEKQRICLARAFLKRSPIIILDEPTSALDALTEARIFKRLAEHTSGKTVILISHRLSTIKHAEKIITIDKGRVVEQGTHEQLLKNSGLYADLYNHQNIDV